jgi:hypothetical protein
VQTDHEHRKVRLGRDIDASCFTNRVYQCSEQLAAATASVQQMEDQLKEKDALYRSAYTQMQRMYEVGHSSCKHSTLKLTNLYYDSTLASLPLYQI